MTTKIGKVLAIEKNPSTIDNFYFWTRSDLILNPFDVIKVNHVDDSITYAVIEEISHITDAGNILAEYISYDFGELTTELATNRVSMNYVKAKIISNNKNYYIPVLNGSDVCLADKMEIQKALGLLSPTNPNSIPCGFIEMYQGNQETDSIKLPVSLDYRFLIGPEGAHLNISGISGLAAKTSYAMFLLKAIQDRNINSSPDDDLDTAFVIFNVKGKDLLAIDTPNDFDGNDIKKKETKRLYKELGISDKPFQNVSYYFPSSEEGKNNSSLDKDTIKNYIKQERAKYYKFSYEDDKDKLDLLFSNLDDPNQTMESIINYIASNQGDFRSVSNWSDFLKTVSTYCESGRKTTNEITVQSWRKFKRIVQKTIYNSELFSEVKNGNEETRLADSLSNIKKNEVHVVDIARLSEDMQAFVFGNVVQSLYDLQLGINENVSQNPPSKIVIFVDELNKYASSDSPKTSPILRQVLDIAERGRSLGIVLFGAEQFKSNIHSRVTGNCSTHAYGRTNSIELAKNDYKFIPSVYKNMMTRLKPGEYIIQNPLFNSLLNIKFPYPIYKQFKS